jgi:RimJ/RimL family protein N-acetyltransferase
MNAEMCAAPASLACARGYCIRVAEPDDEGALLAMWERCSSDTRYGRFLSPVPHFPREHLGHVLASKSTHCSWVASRDDTGDIVGLTSVFRTVPRTGELGLLVEDAAQRRGLGTAMLDLAATHASSMGIGILTATTLVESHHVRRMLERVGRVVAWRDGFTVELQATLDPVYVRYGLSA